MMEVSLFTVNDADVPPKVTAEAPVKPVPVIVTKVPPVNGPAVGLRLVYVGIDVKDAEIVWPIVTLVNM